MVRPLDKPKDKPLRQPTLKQKAFVKNYIEKKNGTQAALAVYDTTDPNVAHSISVDNLRNPTVKLELERQLDEAGLTKSNVLGWLNEAIAAGVGRDARNSDALRGIDYVLKLYGLYPDQKKTVESRSVTVHVQAKEDGDLVSFLRGLTGDVKRPVE